MKVKNNNLLNDYIDNRINKKGGTKWEKQK